MSFYCFVLKVHQPEIYFLGFYFIDEEKTLEK